MLLSLITMATTATTAPSEPFGTTPLPTSSSGSPVKVWLDAERTLPLAQQPQTQQIAVFEATPPDILNGSVLDVNQHFVVYGVKNGLIRILHRHSALRSLLRAHKDQTLTDVKFFQDGDVLATVAHSAERSSVIIWRVFQRSPEILSEILLEVTTTKFTTWRVVWHPFNPNQFWMIHSDARGKTVATLVETTRITTTVHPQHGHAVCDFHEDFVIMQGAVQLTTAGTTDAGDTSGSTADGNLTDLCWSDRETRHVLTTHDNGEIRLWDLKKLHANPNGTVSPVCMTSIKESDAKLSRCLFLPHEDNGDNNWTTCFLTATEQNTELTLWTAFSERGKPQKIQILGLERPASSYLVDVCSGPAPADASPPSCFVVMADRTAGKIFAFHLRSVWNDAAAGKPKKALLVGSDYVVPFQTKFPTYSWSVVSVPTTDISEEELNEQGGIIFDMKLFAYQSTVVQSLTLTSYMCLPPEKTWTDPTPGVRVERMYNVQSAHVSDIGSDSEDAMVYDEDYDVGDVDNEDESAEYDPPEASALPLPDGLSSPGSGPTHAPLSNNPFANWLGAIAAKNSSTTTAAPLPAAAEDDLPLPAVAPPPPAPSMATTLLSPMHLLMGTQQATSASPVESRSITPSISNKASSAPAQVVPAVKPTSSATATTTATATAAGTKKPRKKSPKRPTTTSAASSTDHGKIQILKRDTPAAATTTSGQGKPETPQKQSLSPLPKLIPVQEHSSMAESEGIMNGISAHSVSADAIRQVVAHEMQATVIPQLEKTIQASLNANVTKPILEALGQLSASKSSSEGAKVDIDQIAASVSRSVDVPLRAAFAESMKVLLIPTLESVTGQVFAQISTHLDQQAEAAQAAVVAAAASKKELQEPNKDLEAISKQLTTMTSLVAKLTDEVQGLRSIVLAQREGSASTGGAAGIEAGETRAPPSVTSKKNAMEALRNEILALLEQKEYENAFTKAVAASSTELTYFCCSSADLNAVLGGAAPTLSQPILLCLMQQLGTILMSAQRDTAILQLVLEWLQEIALSLHPSNPQIQQHAPGVLQQLVAAINSRMAGSDPVLRRPLQRLLQIVRGMTMG